MQHLKQQNQTMAQRIESLRKVLGESKSYTISLKQRNDNLASDMDFQSDLHEKVYICEFAYKYNILYIATQSMEDKDSYISL